MFSVSHGELFRNGESIRISTNFLPSRHAPDHGVDLTYIPHHHDFFELVVILDGEGFHHIGETAHSVFRGDVFIIPPSVPHHFQASHLRLVNVMFRGNVLEPYEHELRQLPGFTALFTLEPRERLEGRRKGHLKLSGSRLEEVERLIHHLIREENSRAPGHSIMAAGLFFQLLTVLAREYQRLSTPEAHRILTISSVISALESQYPRRWTIKELCVRANLSPSTLRRHFIRAVGMPPLRYLAYLRVEKACELLTQTDLTMLEIAEKVGFQDSNYFARQFRRYKGLSPREFRRITRRGVSTRAP
ncbi:helix-turn-helix domain-containing protein [Spirochaeta thermophila]|nr:helix-turn-helix domain-containing protein [Spirochaeta thermophila]